MNVYEFDIWYQVNHNGKFSHTVTRMQLVHALNEERAKKHVTLREGGTRETGSLTIDFTAEVIYATRKTGTVTKQMFYVYSDGRTPRPLREVQ